MAAMRKNSTGIHGDLIKNDYFGGDYVRDDLI